MVTVRTGQGRRRPCWARRDLVGTALVAAVSLAVPVQARDLGQVGPVYPILEADLLQELRSLLEQKQASGELARLQAEAAQRARRRVDAPTPVAGLRRTQAPRRALVDPTLRFDDAVVDGQGRVVVPAGTTINPFNTLRWHNELLFVDGSDPDQVRHAKARLDALGPALKVVLVAGSPTALMRRWRVPVYFDQGGRLVERFGIQQVPARVRQEGLQLQIDEVLP